MNLKDSGLSAKRGYLSSDVGTGGTPFMKYLKKHRDENRAQTI